MTSELSAVCLALEYPGPGSAAMLEQVIRGLPAGSVRSELSAFAGEVGALALGDWEELHTRTLDLSPLFVPYVGHVTWGESYRRGAFMADLQRAQLDAGVDQRGELPDHIVPILSFLDAGGTMPDLVEVLPDAIGAMRKDLRKAEPENPYRFVLAAAAAAVESHVSRGATL
jgi:nitrate reductase molybdenum cofactor assembly chaperone NarJ/NarW